MRFHFYSHKRLCYTFISVLAPFPAGIGGGTEDECNRQAQGRMMRLYWNRMPVGPSLRVVCKVRTQQAENFDEEALGLQDVYYPYGPSLSQRLWKRKEICPKNQETYNLDFFSSSQSLVMPREV